MYQLILKSEHSEPRFLVRPHSNIDDARDNSPALRSPFELLSYYAYNLTDCAASCPSFL